MSETLTNPDQNHNSDANSQWDSLIDYANTTDSNPEPAPKAPADTDTPAETLITDSETFIIPTEDSTETPTANPESVSAPEFQRSRSEETRLAGNFLDDLLKKYEQKPDPEEAKILTRYIDISGRFFGEISDPDNDQSPDQIFDQIAKQYDRTADLYLRLHREEGANEYHQRSLTVKDAQQSYESFANANTIERPSHDSADDLPDPFTATPPEQPVSAVVTENVTEIIPNPDKDAEVPADQPKPGLGNADWLV